MPTSSSANAAAAPLPAFPAPPAIGAAPATAAAAAAASSGAAAAAAAAAAAGAASSAGDPQQREQLLSQLIEQQRRREAARVEAARVAAAEAARNPIWQRDAQWLRQKEENVRRLLAEKERSSGEHSFRPAINARSRQMAEQSRKVRRRAERAGAGARGLARARTKCVR